MADEESPFQSWSRRLIFGPMPLVQQRLQERAKRSEDEYAAEQQGIRDERTAGRQRANILLNIQEQARAQQEKEGREQAAAATRLRGLTEALKPKPSLPALGIMQGSEGPASVPVPLPPRQPTMEDVIPHLTEKGRESMLEKRFALPEKEMGVFETKRGDILKKGTGEEVRKAPTPVPFAPPEGHVLKGVHRNLDTGALTEQYGPIEAPPSLNAAAQQFIDPTGKPYPDYKSLPPNLKKEAFVEASRLAGFGRAEGTEQERRTRPFTRENPEGVVVNRQTFQDETAKGFTIGDVEALQKAGTHTALTKDQANLYRSALDAVDTAKEIRRIGSKLFTAAPGLGTVAKGLLTTGQRLMDVGGGSYYRDLKQQEGKVFSVITLFQSKGQISDSDANLGRSLMAVDSLFTSKPGFAQRINAFDAMIQAALVRTVHGQTVPKDAGITVPALREQAANPSIAPSLPKGTKRVP